MMNRQEIDRERALVGSLAYAPPEASRALMREHGISESTLADPAHRELLRVVASFTSEGQRFQISLALERLSPNTRKAIGGYEGLARMCSPDWLDSMPSVVELVRLARTARERRAVLAALDEARAMVLAERPEALTTLTERLEQAKGQRDADMNAWRPLREIVMGLMVPAMTTRDVVKRRRAGVVPTGIKRLDDLLDGGPPRSLWVLAADPGAGKTGFMVRAAIEQRRLGLTVGVMPLEDPADRIFGRAVGERANTPWHVLTSRDVEVQTQLDAQEGLKQLHDLGDGIYVTESGRTSTTEVLSRLEQLYVQTNGELDAVWIDNSNEVRLDYEDHHRHMDDLLMAVRQWANKRGVSVCFLTHLKRDERKVYVGIRQADLAHSAGFCRIGRLVLGLRQTDQAEEPAIAVDFVKGNEARFGTLFLCFSERGAMPIDREARMRPRQKKKADKQAQLFGAKGDEADAA